MYADDSRPTAERMAIMIDATNCDCDEYGLACQHSNQDQARKLERAAQSESKSPSVSANFDPAPCAVEWELPAGKLRTKSHKITRKVVPADKYDADVAERYAKLVQRFA